MTSALPPAPPGWNKTMADLSAEMQRGERREIGWPESQWAVDYERSLLPPDTRYPRDGDIYEALQDMTVSCFISRAAPFTDAREGLLRQGEQVVVESAGSDRPITVYATPVHARAVQARMVPWWIRFMPGYAGMYFALDTRDLNTRFRLVREAPAQADAAIRKT